MRCPKEGTYFFLNCVLTVCKDDANSTDLVALGLYF